jgi:hypothetical protein
LHGGSCQYIPSVSLYLAPYALATIAMSMMLTVPSLFRSIHVYHFVLSKREQNVYK